MLKVGLTGGYATGKSFVASEFARLGCHIVYADKLGHTVLEPGGEAYDATVQTFGPDVVAPDGTIDRKKLGSIVFNSPELLKKLNNFVHPAVFRLEDRLIEEFASADPEGITVLEAAILIETGHYKAFDRLILTACSEEVQISRGMLRDGLTRDGVVARLSRQMSTEEKKPYAQYVIDTSGPKNETAIEVRRVFEELKQLARGVV